MYALKLIGGIVLVFVVLAIGSCLVASSTPESIISEAEMDRISTRTFERLAQSDLAAFAKLEAEANAFVDLLELHSADGVITEAESRYGCLQVTGAIVSYERLQADMEQRIAENRPVTGIDDSRVYYDVERLKLWAEHTLLLIANAEAIRRDCANLGWLP